MKQWLNTNFLLLNVNKTTFITFSLRVSGIPHLKNIIKISLDKFISIQTKT